MASSVEHLIATSEHFIARMNRRAEVFVRGPAWMTPMQTGISVANDEVATSYADGRADVDRTVGEAAEEGRRWEICRDHCEVSPTSPLQDRQQAGLDAIPFHSLRHFIALVRRK